jgi:putative nucleotidyltransferase with HDIG domain
MLMNDNAKPRYDARTQIAKLTAITAALEIKDPYTRGHARRVAVYARRLAERIGLNAVEAEKIRLGGLLHDIGKIGLSEQLLNNTRNRLSADMLAEVPKRSSILSIFITKKWMAAVIPMDSGATRYPWVPK